MTIRPPLRRSAASLQCFSVKENGRMRNRCGATHWLCGAKEGKLTSRTAFLPCAVSAKPLRRKANGRRRKECGVNRCPCGANGEELKNGNPCTRCASWV